MATLPPHQALEPMPPNAQQADGGADITARDLDRYPECLFAHDMAAIFRVSVKRVYALSREGAFDFARNRPRIGRLSWSRARVRQYFAGEIHGLTVTRRKAS